MNHLENGSTDLLEPLRRKSEIIWRDGVIAILVVMFAIQIPALAVLLLFGYLYCRGWMKRPVNSTSTSHGSARWATHHDLIAAGCLGTQHGFVIGRAPDVRSASAALVRVPEARFPHLSVAGPAGSGKSTAFSILNLLQHDPAGCVVLDPKGENARATAAWRAEHLGHEIAIIDPFGVVGPHRFPRGKLNPLQFQAVAEQMIVDDARRLANALVVRTPDEREPFWNNSAQVLIQGMIALLMAAGKPAEIHLGRVRDILTNPSLVEEAVQCMNRIDACGGLLKRIAGQLSQLKGQTAASVFGVANSHLEFLDSLPITEVVTQTSFNPQGLLDNRLTIYLCLPVDRLKEMRGLQRVLLTCLINFVFQAGESRTRRVRFLLDEAASLGEIDALYNSIMFGRGYGVRAALLFQSLSQIAICFPDSKVNDYKGTVASVFTGVCDFNGAEEVSKWIGQTTTLNYSQQMSSNWGYSISHGGQDIQRGNNSGGGDSETYGQVGRALIQAEEILQLPSSAAIALLPGIRPMLLLKVPYFQWLKEQATKALPRWSIWRRKRKQGTPGWVRWSVVALVLAAAALLAAHASRQQPNAPYSATVSDPFHREVPGEARWDR
jgi:type IV secretion system protein VirD4